MISSSVKLDSDIGFRSGEQRHIKSDDACLPGLPLGDTFARLFAHNSRGSESIDVAITYRSFHNTDPPRLVELWNQSELGSSAAGDLTVDAFEFFVFAQPYFDKKGLILALDGETCVGFVHAVQAVNEEQSALTPTSGGIIALLVHPKCRRQGIGRQLLSHASEYLRSSGATSIEFGPSPRTNGFYLGMYGGVAPVGFRDADQVEPFAAATGWQTARTFNCYQKDLSGKTRDPVNMKLITNKRKTKLNAVDASNNASWWWMTRFGRMDSVEFQLVEKSSGEVYASCDIFGLDLYIPKWGQRAAGLGSVNVSEQYVGNDYELSLLIEMGRYLRDQLITVIDTSAASDDSTQTALLESAGFQLQDVSRVFQPA